MYFHVELASMWLSSKFNYHPEARFTRFTVQTGRKQKEGELLCVCVRERDDPRILPFISTSTLAKKGGCLIVRVHQEKADLPTSVGLSSRQDGKKL